MILHPTSEESDAIERMFSGTNNFHVEQFRGLIDRSIADINQNLLSSNDTNQMLKLAGAEITLKELRKLLT